MSKYQQFVFDSYNFNAASKTLTLKYNYDDSLFFEESFRFDFDFADYSQEAFDRACQLLFFVAGVSYYKSYVAPEIAVRSGQIDQNLANFLQVTYQKGLGEFFYVNSLSPSTAINFPVNSNLLTKIETRGTDGLIVGIGGGKDSLLSVEILKNQTDVATWSLNHKSQLQPLVSKIGLPHLYVERQWDKKLLELNNQDALNGHVPISAIIASVGLVVCVLGGKKYHVVSNESSASEPNLVYEGVEINHQYSKSLEFEQEFQGVLTNLFGEGFGYFSLLRPISELRIAELFSKKVLDKYNGVFSSCNRAFTHDSEHIFWCGECPKCAFVFLVLSPFVERSKLEAIFGGKNLLLNPSLELTYKKLLGIEGDKPLECVGEIKESRTAMRLAQKTYPELAKYEFDIPEDYDYKSVGKHSMPEFYFSLLETFLQPE